VGVAGEYEHPRLTRRERELLAEILAGRNNKAIALKFRVKEQTVRNQLAVLFHKVGVSSRLELAVKFAKRTLDPM
jgi:two-component system nitrate/nitrite response regulator NarL